MSAEAIVELLFSSTGMTEILLLPPPPARTLNNTDILNSFSMFPARNQTAIPKSNLKKAKLLNQHGPAGVLSTSKREEMAQTCLP
jgi:hypothetical protein